MRVLRYGFASAFAVMGLAIRGSTLASHTHTALLVLSIVCQVGAVVVGVLFLCPLFLHKRAARHGHGWFFGQPSSEASGGGIHAVLSLLTLLVQKYQY